MVEEEENLVDYSIHPFREYSIFPIDEYLIYKWNLERELAQMDNGISC
jgi:hypothetical protein